MNKEETMNWRGNIPINKYEILNDPSPKVIKKESKRTLQYVQHLSIKYLRPETPQNESHGDIIIHEMDSFVPPPAPPVIIRQRVKRKPTPETVVIRERPPSLPKSARNKILTIKAKTYPPPPRKLIIEKVPEEPAKPPKVTIERWLPYKQQERKVIKSILKLISEKNLFKPKKK